MNVASSLARALREERWAAGPAGAYVRLAGGTVDHHASLVSDVLVLDRPFNTLSVRTRLPILVPGRHAEAASAFSIAINASSRDTILAITADGVPELISKRMLPEHEKKAASLIGATVKANRALADAIVSPLLELSCGARPETVLGGTPAERCLPFSGEPRAAATLLDALAAATEATPELAESTLSELEAVAFGVYVMLQDTLEGSPVCAGPVLMHADGTIECYGCSEPKEHLHPAGTSMSCAAGYTFGRGHRCQRCSAGA